MSANREVSVPEIYILKGLGDLEFFDQGNHSLKVVSLLTRNAQLVALDGDLHLQLCSLDDLNDLLGQVTLDALLDADRLAQRVPRGLLRLGKIKCASIYLPSGQIPAQQFLHLFHLEVVISPDYPVASDPSIEQLLPLKS